MNTEANDSDPIEVSGVQRLIDRLHEDGVERGKSDAETLLADTRREAAEILHRARQQADEIRESARKDADQMKSRGEDAVRLAGRDAILKLTEELRASFEQTLRRLVNESLEDPEFLRSLLLQIAGVAVPEATDSEMRILLLRGADPGADRDDSDGHTALDELARSLAGQSLRDGLTFQLADSDVPGVRVQVVDQELEIDLTTDTLTHLLLKHLTPRVRGILGQ